MGDRGHPPHIELHVQYFIVTSLFDITLAVITAASTLSAFGGKTTNDGPEPLYKRINTRGKISLGCLFLTLILGITKYVETAIENETNDKLGRAQKERDQADANARDAILKQQLAEANRKADLASLALNNLQGIDKANLDRLDEAKVNLTDLKTDLTSTRQNLNEQSQANLLAAIAQSRLKIKDVKIFIPLLKTAPIPETTSDAFLPRFDLKECQDRTDAEVSIMTSAHDLKHLIYKSSDDNAVDADNSESSGEIEKDDIHWRASSSNGYVFAASMEVNGRSLWPAEMYSVFANATGLGDVIATFGTGPLSIVTSWRLSADKDKESQIAQEMLSKLSYSSRSALDLEDADPKDEIVIPAMRTIVQKDYPHACSDRIRHHFEVSFERAYILATLDGTQGQTILFPLKALAPRLIDNMWTIVFVGDGNPKIAFLPEYQQNKELSQPR